jgi:ABC-2 type transport system permease protein
MFAIAGKDLRLLVRDRPRLALTIAWPVLIAVFFGMVGPQDTPVILEVELQCPTDRAPAIAAALSNRTDIRLLSDAVAKRAGQAPIPRLIVACEENQSLRIRGSAPLQRRQVSDALVAGLLAQTPTRAYGPVIVLEDDPNWVGAPASVPKNGHETTFPQGMVWALLSLAAKFGLEFSTENERGTLLRLHVAPLSPYVVVIAKTLACALAMMMMVALMLALGVFVFDLSFAHPLSFLLAASTSVFAYCGIMAGIGVAARKTQAAGNISWAILMTLAMIGGGMVPAHLLPAFAQNLAQISPVYWSIRALESGLWRNASFTETFVYNLALLVVGAFGLALGGRLLAKYER